MKILTFATKIRVLFVIGTFASCLTAQQSAFEPEKIASKIEQKGSKNLVITDCFGIQNAPVFGNPTFLKYPSKDFNMIQFVMNKSRSNHLYLIPASEAYNEKNTNLFIHLDSFTDALKTAIVIYKNKTGESLKDENIKLNNVPTINWNSVFSGWFEYNGFIVKLNLESSQSWKFESNSIRLNKDSKSTMTMQDSKDLSTSPVGLNLSVLYKVEDNSGTSLSLVNYNATNILGRTAYIKDHNLYVVGNDQEKRQITTDGKEGIVYGQSVHRNEFGINGGMFWSNDLSQLAFYRMDESRVTKYPMFDIKPRPAQPTEIRYPMAGDSSHTVTLGIYNLQTQKTIYLNTQGSYDHYLTNITWAPDGKSIYLFWVNRDQNKTELREYSLVDGNLIKIHLEYTHPKYTEPENGLIFSKSIPEGFIFQSEHSGFNHLYLYLKNNTNIPKKIKANKNTQIFADGGVFNHYGFLFPITQGNWEVTEVLGLDATENQIIYLSTYSSKGNEQGALNRVPLISNIQTGETKWIHKAVNRSITNERNKNNNESELLEEYVQLALWMPGVNKLLLQTSTISQPMNLYSVDLTEVMVNSKSNKKIATALLFYAASNPTANFNMGEVKLESIKNQGVVLFQRTFLPPNFDSNKKYPVVVYLYGGPHAQMVTNGWLGGGNLWMAYMASEGYIVYTIDNRGSSHRGLDFENATHRNLGTIEMQDQLLGLDYLKSLPYVDSTRIGVHGWSFGGFMTTSLMTRFPGKYKVGIAGGPVIDWSFYEIMYTERYMDRPDENPNGYAQNNLLNHAHKLQGPLLMIHGADDDVVVWQHSLMFADKCVKSMNTKLDYFVYPGHKHNVVGRDRAHLYKKISEYFFEKL